MRIDFTIDGSFRVPDGTVPVAGTYNIFRLPTGQLVSVHPVIEMASSEDADDHTDLTYAQGLAIGVEFELYERDSRPSAED
jgi:hypothetical protein